MLNKSKKMYKLFLCLMAIVILSSSCLKNDKGCSFQTSTITAPQAEQDSLKAILDSSDITATKDPSGFYYEILSPGTGDAPPVLCSYITVSYAGTLRNGTQFDKNTSVQFQLGMVIDGWKLGIPLVKKGGHIKLYVPPSLGYRNQDVKDNNGNIVIPKNSILFFDVTLEDYTAGN